MIVVLGDSISAGTGASHVLARFPARLPASLVVAKPGWTSKRLLKEVERQSPIIWKEASDIVILIGGNDLLFAYPYVASDKKSPESVQKVFDQYEQSIQAICEIIKLQMKPSARLYLVGLYNPFPQVDRAVQMVNRINSITQHTAKQHRAAYVDLYSVFIKREAKLIDGYKRGALEDIRIFGNPIHPNDDGHQTIASVILSVIEKRKKMTVKKKMNPKAT